MTDEKPKADLRPSTSTVASLSIGVPVATIIAWVLSTFAGVEVPGPVEAAFGAVISTVVGYFFVGGRAAHTEE